MKSLYIYFYISLHVSMLLCSDKIPPFNYPFHAELVTLFFVQKHELFTNPAELQKTKEKIEAGTAHPSLWICYHEVMEELKHEEEIRRQLEVCITQAVKSVWEYTPEEQQEIITESEHDIKKINHSLTGRIERFQETILDDPDTFFHLALLDRSKILHPIIRNVIAELRPSFEGRWSSIQEPLLERLQTEHDNFAKDFDDIKTKITSDSDLYQAAQRLRDTEHMGPYLKIIFMDEDDET